MIQEKEAQGGEGRLAPAWIEWHSTSGGKPHFPTMSCLFLERFRPANSTATRAGMRVIED